MDVEDDDEDFPSSQSTIYENGIPPPTSTKRLKRSGDSLSPTSVPNTKRTHHVATYDGQAIKFFPEDKHYVLHEIHPCMTANDARHNIDKFCDMEDYGSVSREDSLNEHYESIHLMQAEQVRDLAEYENLGTHILYICSSEAAKNLLKEKLQHVGFLGHKINTFHDFTPPKWSSSSDPVQDEDEAEFTIIQSDMYLERIATNDLIRYAKRLCPPQESLELVKLIQKEESAQRITEWLFTLNQKQPSF
jgi:hypothetical protein